jgi:L-alanine-DL-glutamate epimerase-like enolase superfamily enzyme
MAGWDLFGKMKQKNLFQLWDTEWNNLPITDYTIGIDTVEVMVNKMKAKPYQFIKLNWEQKMILLS